MLIEILGVPGAGKSTLTRALLPVLRSAGVPARRADRLARLDSADPNAPRYLKRGPERVALYRSLTFRRSYPKLMDHIEGKLALSPADAFLFTWTATLYEAAQEHGPKRGFTLLDEGFVHRGASAHLTEARKRFDDYLALIPVPDVVLNLCPPPGLALQRAIERRAEKAFSREKVEAKFGDETAFQKRYSMMEAAVSRLRSCGATVLDVDTTASVDICVEEILPSLLAIRAAHLAPDTAAE